MIEPPVLFIAFMASARAHENGIKIDALGCSPVFQCGVFGSAYNGNAGVIDQHVQPTTACNTGV